MPASIKVENHAADFDTDLDAALSFAVNNAGDVDVELSFDASGTTTPLPARTSMNFDFVGDRYSGKLYGRFVAAAGQPTSQIQRVSIIKTLYYCQNS